MVHGERWGDGKDAKVDRGKTKTKSQLHTHSHRIKNNQTTKEGGERGRERTILDLSLP